MEGRSPVLGMQPTYDHLKYAYLDDHQHFPIIIANNLHREQEEKLLNILRKHKKAIMILRKEFRVVQKLIAGKLRSRWDGPFVVTNVFLYGAVELRDEATNRIFKVNGHQLKPFHEGPTMMVDEMESILLIDSRKTQLEKISSSPL
ncbi:hypothetical protein CR513_48551, partial [Mucuna pruriens]